MFSTEGLKLVDEIFVGLISVVCQSGLKRYKFVLSAFVKRQSVFVNIKI